MNVGEIDFGKNAYFEVTNKATLGYNRYRGFVGPTSDGDSALLVMANAEANSGGYIRYANNLIVSCSNHFKSSPGNGKTVELDGAVMCEDNKANISINSSACNPGYNVKKAPTNIYYTYEIYYSGLYLMEDMWPAYGDYDMNDVVCKLEVTASSEDSSLVEGTVLPLKKATVNATFEATGADNKIGVGLQFSKIPASYVYSGDIESMQDSAVVMFTTNIAKTFGGENYYNVRAASRSTDNYVTITKELSFNQGFTAEAFTKSALNFFITVNAPSSGLRREVHLKGFSTTTLGETNLRKIYASLDSWVDLVELNDSDMYVSKYNLPWGICLPTDVDFYWPNETTRITTVYSTFADWANSGGLLYTDWYEHYSGN